MLIIEQGQRLINSGPVPVRDLSFRLLGEEHRVILLSFISGSFTSGNRLQVQAIFDFLDTLSDEDAANELQRVERRYANRHADFRERLLENYERARYVAGVELPNHTRRLLAGSYFTMEYAFQSSALFNPSIVPHPDQGGLPEGSVRFVMSLRAVGEGHLSSVVFHTGTIDSGGGVAFDVPALYTAPTQISPDRFYVKALFLRRLVGLDMDGPIVDECLRELPDSFSPAELDNAVAKIRSSAPVSPRLHTCLENILWLARSNYRLSLAPGSAINQLFLFPKSDNESRGIEDLRLVRFVDDDGAVTYFGTYTAFNGSAIMPVLLETRDFRSVSMHTLNGACAQNKGMALFPRKIGGRYAMCSRIDGRNLFLMYSDNVNFWETAVLLAAPKFAWEFRLIGNCGSPIETPEGWLLITHGVGEMRQYAIGAMLLDLHDPSKILGRLREPLIVSNEDEREGYVPNVVYSCGSLAWNGKLVLPYAISDRKTALAEIDINLLLQKLLADKP